MDTDDNIITRQYYKCEESVRTLNIKYNHYTTMMTLWNKNQIFTYEDLNFTKVSKYILPQYRIHNLLLSNNYIVCLDVNGNAHTISLKFKNANFMIKSPCLPVLQNVLAIFHLTPETLLCLRLNSVNLILSRHKINAQLQLEEQIPILSNTENVLEHYTQSKCILKAWKLIMTDLNKIKCLEIPGSETTDHYLVIMSLDELTIHAAIFGNQTVEMSLQKLYSCASPICDIDVKDLQIVVALKIGTVIILNLENDEHKKIHLNTAIHKFAVRSNNIVYTDGMTMWTTSMSDDKNIKSYFPKQINDFIIIGEQIICTTFTNALYSFSLDDYQLDFHDNERDTPAEAVLNNMECLNEIFEEIERNNKITKKIKEEEVYLSCLALANRKDIMNSVFLTNITVYLSYEDVQREHSKIFLTEKLKQYFRPDTSLFLVEISTTNIHHVIKAVLTNLIENIRIHITLASGNKILQCVSIKLREYMKRAKYLVPLKSKLSQINVNIKIIVKLPGVHEKKECVYIDLYTKDVLLTAEHFIKTDMNKAICLKKPDTTLQELIFKTFERLHRNLYEIQAINIMNNPYCFYVKLPENYKEIFKSDTCCKKYVQKRVYDVLSNQYSSDDFLNSKTNLKIEIGESKIFVEVVNDGFSEPSLKITGDMRIGYDIRNFFAKILYDTNENIAREVNHTLYTIVENLQKSVKGYIFQSSKDFSPVFDQFERNIIGSLPI